MDRMARLLAQAGAAARRALAPACLLCALEPGDPFCAGCLADYFPRALARCRGCASRLPPPAAADTLCGRCLSAPRRFDAAFALADYGFPVDALVGALKFRARLDVGRALGAVLAQRYREWAALQPDRAPAATAVVPMPLAPRRWQERGYNQAEELARALAATLGLPLARDALRRTGERAPQQGLSLSRRRTNVRGVFRAAPGLREPHALLVDDVLTSGSTMEEAAACLKEAGVARVSALVAARTP
jgi:ComF family protein